MPLSNTQSRNPLKQQAVTLRVGILQLSLAYALTLRIGILQSAARLSTVTILDCDHRKLAP